MKYNLKSVKTSKLDKNLIKKICKLKNTHWKYGLESQLNWFRLNCKSQDIHNLVLINKKIIGYTFLRIRKILPYPKKKKYLYFDTLNIDKKYRKKKLSNILMKFNNDVIKKNKFESILICNKKLIKFYLKNNWKKIPNKYIKIMDHKVSFKNPFFFIFNSKNKNYKIRKIFLTI